MRAAIEALLVVGGSLGLFWLVWRGWLDLRRQQQKDRRAEDKWLDDQINH